METYGLNIYIGKDKYQNNIEFTSNKRSRAAEKKKSF